MNLGDGFILRAIERRVGRFPEAALLSPRVSLNGDALRLVESSPAVILAGANQLHDRYTVWPGLDADTIRARRLRLIPFGIGLHGEPGYNDGFSDASREILVAMHEQIEFSSWRCPRTVQLLHRELPKLASQILMTGCPVTYDRPLLEGQAFPMSAKRIAVTVTERGDFWKRETDTLDFVARHYPRAERYLVLHQNYDPPSRLELWRHRWLPQHAESLNEYQRLRQFAVRRGFTVIAPPDADACIAFYGSVDMHIGSRLHAHLLCLSQAKRSWLIPVDGRSTGMAEFLQFPLCDPENIGAALDFDFEIVRAQARLGFVEMQRFLSTLPA